ncbi:DgyrCDS3440 [Dimorphilus gyrociliatus]|uniref:DgyrCDS3440 n=1 Tax=Dimorphilus gyrociliatus TaxID=2664684 RepID=A0A7I8VF53_9ANNE|nr:DgyrCDS3440 [Dimorphilus gyrociliatus]
MEPSGRPPDVNKKPNFLNFDNLKAIRIPKTRHEKGKGSSVLEKVDLNSFMFSNELLKIIEKSFLRFESKRNFEYKGAQFVNNRVKMNMFNNRRKELKASGYSERELKEEYGFMILHPNNPEKFNELSVHGVKVGNNKKNILGSSSKGVLLSRHADLVASHHLEPGDVFDLFIFKYIRGRMKAIDPSENEIDPTFNFDAHIMKGGETIKQKLNHLSISQAFGYAQIFLYEYDETAEIVESPRHVCPHAIVSVKLQNRYRMFKDVKITRRSVDLADSSIKIQRYSVPPKHQLSYNLHLPSTSSTLSSGKNEAAPANQSHPNPPTAKSSENRIVWKGHLSTNKNRILCECILVSNNSLLVSIELPKVIYLQNRIGLHDVEDKHFSGVTAISFKKESLNSQNGYINAFKLKQADGCSKTLNGISNYFANTHSAGLADLPNGYRILVFPLCELTEKLGLPKENTSADVFVIILSRTSLQLPQKASIFTAPKVGARTKEQGIPGKISEQQKVLMSRKHTKSCTDPGEIHQGNVTNWVSTNVQKVAGEPTGRMSIITNTECIGPARERNDQDRDRCHITDHVKKSNRKGSHGGERNRKHHPEKRKYSTSIQHQKTIKENIGQIDNEIPSKQKKRNGDSKESRTELNNLSKKSIESITPDESSSKLNNFRAINKILTYQYYMDDFPSPSKSILRSRKTFSCPFDYYFALKKKFVSDIQNYLTSHPSIQGTPSSTSSLTFTDSSSVSNKNGSSESVDKKSETKASKGQENKHSSKKSNRPKDERVKSVEAIPSKSISQTRRVELKSNGKKFINPNYDEFSDSAPIKSYAFVSYDYDKTSYKSNWIIGEEGELERPIEDINCMKNLMDFTVTIQGLSDGNRKKLEKSGTGRIAMTYLVLHGQLSTHDETKHEETLIESLWLEGLHSFIPKSIREISDRRDSKEDNSIFHVRQLMKNNNGVSEIIQSFKRANNAPNDRVAAMTFLRSSYKKYESPLEVEDEATYTAELDSSCYSKELRQKQIEILKQRDNSVITDFPEDQGWPLTLYKIDFSEEANGEKAEENWYEEEYSVGNLFVNIDNNSEYFFNFINFNIDSISEISSTDRVRLWIDQGQHGSCYLSSQNNSQSIKLIDTDRYGRKKWSNCNNYKLSSRTLQLSQVHTWIDNFLETEIEALQRNMKALGLGLKAEERLEHLHALSEQTVLGSTSDNTKIKEVFTQFRLDWLRKDPLDKVIREKSNCFKPNKSIPMRFTVQSIVRDEIQIFDVETQKILHAIPSINKLKDPTSANQHKTVQQYLKKIAKAVNCRKRGSSDESTSTSISSKAQKLDLQSVSEKFSNNKANGYKSVDSFNLSVATLEKSIKNFISNLRLDNDLKLQRPLKVRRKTKNIKYFEEKINEDISVIFKDVANSSEKLLNSFSQHSVKVLLVKRLENDMLILAVKNQDAFVKRAEKILQLENNTFLKSLLFAIRDKRETSEMLDMQLNQTSLDIIAEKGFIEILDSLQVEFDKIGGTNDSELRTRFSNKNFTLRLSENANYVMKQRDYLAAIEKDNHFRRGNGEFEIRGSVDESNELRKKNCFTIENNTERTVVLAKKEVIREDGEITSEDGKI